MNQFSKKMSCLLIAATVFMGGCGSSGSLNSSQQGEQPTDMDGTVALRVWGAEEDAALLEQISSQFQAQYPDTQFDITIEAMPESDCKENLLGDVNNAPDVFTFADDQLSALAASGVLEPVANAEEIAARNSESSVAAASINDELYAYPLTADNGYFMFYNKAYFTDDDLQTLDGMLAVAAANDKKVTMDWSSGWYLYSFFGNTGLSIGLNEDGISNYCDWNSTSGSIKGTDVAEAMLAIANNPGFLNGTDSVLVEGAKDGSVIAGISGVWSANAIEEAWGDNYGAVKLPTYTCAGQQIQMSSYAGYKMVGVNSYSPYADWAAQFADFMSNEDNQNLRFEQRAQGPANKNAAASGAVAESPAIQALISQSSYASLQRIGATYWTPVADFGILMSTGSTGGQELQDIMDALVDKITASMT
ncbi:MAG: extracellular solute-binding protein [Roseburia sp.]